MNYKGLDIGQASVDNKGMGLVGHWRTLIYFLRSNASGIFHLQMIFHEPFKLGLDNGYLCTANQGLTLGLVASNDLMYVKQSNYTIMVYITVWTILNIL